MTDSVAGERLKSFIERIENLEAAKKSYQEDIKETYSEAKGVGFDPKVIKEIIKIRAKDKAAQAEFEDLLDLYKKAVGM